jgi:hypothetical protein
VCNGLGRAGGEGGQDKLGSYKHNTI